jgi:FKBP-type peptidyl-prolyl cis-trans isomerase
VTVSATAWQVSGNRMFWSTRDRYGERPFSWVLFKGNQCEGFDRAVASMRVGERASFLISSTFAYGVAGDAKLGVPGNANIKVEFTLKKIEDTPQRV